MYEYSTLVAHPYDTSVKALKTVQTYSKEEVIYKFTSDMNQTNLICATSPVYILDCIQKETRTARVSKRTVESAMGSRGISDTLPRELELEPQDTSFKLSAELSAESLPA